MVSEYKRFRDYELMVIFHPELSEEDVAAESDRVQAYLTGAAATVTLVNREAPWGRRRLAYPIRHGSRDLRDGIYGLYYFNSESGRIEEIEREIKLNDRVIRYLLTQQIAPIMEPAPAEGEALEGGEAAPAPDEPVASQRTAPAEGAPAGEGETAAATAPEIQVEAAGEELATDQTDEPAPVVETEEADSTESAPEDAESEPTAS